MNQGKHKKKTGITRREFIKATSTAGLLGAVFSNRIPPALAKGKRNLIYGGFGGNVGHLSPVIRHDTAAGLVIRNIFDNLVMPNYETRAIEPVLAKSWKNTDPLTWQIKMREGVKWQKGYGELTAENLHYTWQFHLDSKSWIIRSGLWPLDKMKMTSKYAIQSETARSNSYPLRATM